MFRATVLLAPVLLCLAMRIQPQSLSREVVERISSSTVYLEMRQEIAVASEPVASSATGFLVSDRGHVVTSYHAVAPVVTGSGISFPAPLTTLRVIIHSGTPEQVGLPGRVVAVDKAHDLAVVKIDYDGGDALPRGSSDSLIATTPVWAFGYPYGEAFSVLHRGPEVSVSRGTVSALRHDDRGELQLVQIDVPVNPGNSGGPLVDRTGSVVGIVNLRVPSQVNFAVPVAFLTALLRTLDPDRPIPDSSTLRIVSTPPGASVFSNGIFAGHTPLDSFRVPSARQVLYVVKDGYEAWMSDTAILGDGAVELGLTPYRGMPLRIAGESDGGRPCERSPAESMPETAVLLAEDFDDQVRFESWKQTTGGTSKRTWFLRDGAVHQHESDEMLHAIFLGERSWKHYSVSVKTWIRDEHDDSRAGLIFRETDEGFYLFRIHKESDKAQLAYHSRHPFGWFILAQRALDKDIGDSSHVLRVDVRGDSIHCFLDGACVFDRREGYSNRGGTGLYSVESKASFDSLRVVELEQADTGPLSPEPLVSFWFTDEFDYRSVWWRHRADHSPAPAPWRFSDAGCVQVMDDTVMRLGEMTRYELVNLAADLLVTAGGGADEAHYGFVFRKRGAEYWAVLLTGERRGLHVVHRGADGRSRVRLRRQLPLDPFEQTVRLSISVQGSTVMCMVQGQTVFSGRLRGLSEQSGRVGIVSRGVPLILHRLTVSSAHPG